MTDTPPPDKFIGPVDVDTLQAAIENEKIDDHSKEIRDKEWEYIAAYRRETGRDGESKNALTGLAISGGGIRSATFALGVMQALASRDRLKMLDYLSTVSGGGYIGTSLSWLVSEAAGSQEKTTNKKAFGVKRENFPYGTDDPSNPHTGGKDTADQKAMLGYLRGHGNYLTPGEGITALSFAAIILRAILLNLLVWLPIATFVMILLMVAGEAISSLLAQSDFVRSVVLPSVDEMAGFDTKQILRTGPTFLFDISLGLAALLALFFLLVCVIYSLRTFRARMADPAKRTTKRYDLRRFFETWASRHFWTIAVLAVFGSLPHTWESIAAPVGPSSVVLGIASAVWGFVRSESKKNGWLPIGPVLTIGALLFIYGIAIVTYGVAFSLLTNTEPEATSVYVLLAVLVIVALVTGYRVNLNYISIHRYYRDRLMESYMPDIDRAIGNITGPAKQADTARTHNLWNGKIARAPYHIVNTNVVLVDSSEPRDRRYRIRGGDNYILTPLYSGSNATGWRLTRNFMNGGMTMGTAMAISGAAANPNTGVGGVGLTRDRFVSFLMSFLNLRLGYWAHHPNPTKTPGHSANHLIPGLYQIFPPGHTKDRKFIEISDGGHFENLGLYELVRRRLKLIVLCDGGADKEFSYSDLQIALRRAGVDFGAHISFTGDNRPRRLIPYEDLGYPKGAKRTDQGHIVGEITYDGGKEKGILIYLKTTIIPGLRTELKGYKGAHPDFPDESTVDQFFDEEQFEAYRELGYRIAMGMIEDIEGDQQYDPDPGDENDPRRVLRAFIPSRGGSRVLQ